MGDIYASGIREYSYDKVFGNAEKADFPARFELDREISVKDQMLGDREIMACAACAIASAAEYMWEKDFSEGYAYARLRSDNYNRPGLYLSIALDLWRKKGIALLSDFGTLEEMPEIKELVDKFPELDEKAAQWKIGGHASLDYSDREKKDNAIKDALMRDGVPLIASSDSYFAGNHAFLIVGWNDESNTYIYQNSYGRDFGENGRSEIPKAHVDDVYAVFASETELPFKDVEKDRWSYKDIKNMYMAGIINGTSEDTFEPERAITREEVAAMINRLAEKIDEKLERIYKQIHETKE